MSRLLQNVWGPVVIVAAWVLVAGGFGAALAADAPAGFEDLKAAIKEARPPEAAPATTPATPAGLPAEGQSVEIGQSGSSRGIELAVERLSVRNEYGALAAPQGSVLLVLDTKWTNIIPLTYIYERM